MQNRNVLPPIKSLVLSALLFIPLTNTSWAIPVDWQGTFGVDSGHLRNYRRTEALTSGVTGSEGNQFVAPAAGASHKLSLQNYLLKLNPKILINDALTFHGELTTGYDYGGLLGDSSANRKSTEGSAPNFGNANYLFNTGSASPNLRFSQYYLEIFSDTGTYLLGRHTAHFGLGAIFNNGEGAWDRLASVRDGVQAKIKIGNFEINPYWAKINTEQDLTHLSDTTSYGVSMLYHNLERDLRFGLLLGRKQSEGNNDFYKNDTDGAPLGRVQAKITDLYVEKSLANLHFALEVPILSGELGSVYQAETNTEYKALGILFESKYQLNNQWSFGLDFGQVSGDNGSGSSFEALYLHPNYQKALILFRHNLSAVKDRTQSLYDANITNATYLKLSTHYLDDLWSYSLSGIYAKSHRPIKAGTSYDHQRNKVITPSFNQEDDMGFEIDFSVGYRWNPNMTITGNFGHHIVGDFYSFNNTATPTALENVSLAQIRALVQF